MSAHSSAIEEVRRPFLIAALVAMVLVVSIELGEQLLPFEPPRGEELTELLPAELRADARNVATASSGEAARPGIAISYLALLDGLLTVLLALFVLALIVPGNILAAVQGGVNVVAAIIVLISAMVMIPIALVLLTIMFSLFVAAPFGTIAYAAIWGGFDRSGAGVTLSVLMILKLASGVLLGLAQQRNLVNKGLVALILSSLVATVIVSFLHGFVPRVMVSITDALAAIIVGIIAVIWALVFLLGGVVSLFKSLKLLRRAA